MSRKLYYESKEHYYNTCRKMIAKKNFESNEITNDDTFREFCFVLFDLTQTNEDELLKKRLRRPLEVFTYFIGQKSNSVNELMNNICLMIDLYNDYRILLQDDSSVDLFPRLIEYCLFDYDVTSFTIWNKEKQDYDTFSYIGDFAKLCESIFGESGIYILHNEHKKPVYIGKSVNLGSRIPESLREREKQLPIFYVSYAKTKTKSDMHIYELFYIAQLKPQLNSDSKEWDELTVTLPDLEFSDLIPIKEPIKGR